MNVETGTYMRPSSGSLGRSLRHTQIPAWILTFLLLCLAPALPAQTKKSKPAAGIGPAGMSPLQSYRLAVRERSSVAATVVGNYGDSLAGVVSGASASAGRVFNFFSDSVVTRIADSLSAERRVRLDNLRKRVISAAAASSDHHLVAIRGIAEASRQMILASANRAAACDDCREFDDFDGRRDFFVSWCDSTRDASIEALSMRAELALDSLSQAYENSRDSVSEQAESFLEEENEEREARADSIALDEETASRLTITLAYDNPVAYLGRDNGVRFSGVSPTILYSHRSGLFASVSGSWLNKAKDNWDVTAVSAGFGRSMGDAWYGSLSYTHLWFSATSSQAKSVLDNSLDFAIDWSGSLLTAGAQVSLAFSKSSEASLVLSASVPLTLFEGAGRGSLVFEPGISGAYGQQDASLESARKQKSNQKGSALANVKPRKTIAVMDYELCLPLSYRRGAFACSAAYTIVAPLNVVDASTSSLFGIFGIDVSMTIR